MTKRYKGIDVDRKEMETNIGVDVRRIDRDKENVIERDRREFRLANFFSKIWEVAEKM